MAFQGPSTFMGMASTILEAWPSARPSLELPWRNFRESTAFPKARRQSGVRERQISTAALELKNKARSAVDLPDFLASVPMASLRPLQFSGNFMGKGVFGITSIPPSKILLSANPFSHAHPTTKDIRPYTTHSILKFVGSKRISPFTLSSITQRRGFFAGTVSQNLLAHMEQTANNNPTSPTAQNAFYSALLRADMPAIVVERYQTGRFATNAAVDATFNRALERLAQTNAGTNTHLSGHLQGQNPSLASQQQLQAVGQALAASSKGGNIGIVRGKDGSNGTGAKQSPLYVVVEESTSAMLFKWVKFVLYFALVAYLILIVFSFAVEATGVIKKVGGIQNNEAQPQHQTVRFSDVHGCDEAKEELQELVEFLKSPTKFSALGGKLPKGVLLVGPPGTGKTLLARAVAGESGVPFFFMSGAEFDEIYVGVGAKRVRDLFTAARAKAPAIIFIDELDAIGGKRNERDPAYVKQSLNQLLTELDGFSQETGVIIIAATNFPQLLDKALTRPGRFDRNVVVPLPDVRGRVDILKHHLKKVQVSSEVDETVIARGTPGFSGAELENLVNQAAVHASRNKSAKVEASDFDWAKDKIIMGAERRSAVIQEKDKIMTAYHEGGHALIALSNPSASPLYKVTIMPRGQSLGLTQCMPEMDKVSMAKKEYLAQIDVCMGGKVAEELVYGADSVTSGCSSDLQQATSIAYDMVTKMGMSELLGNMDYSDYNQLSSDTKQQIEHEVRRILEEGRQRATKILTDRRRDLDILAKALVEYEVLTADELRRVLKGEKLPKLTIPPHVPIKLPEIIVPPSIGYSPPGGSGTGGGLGAAPVVAGSSATVAAAAEPEGSNGGAKL